MAEQIVLDASAALALLRAEPAGETVAAVLRGHAAEGGEIQVPDHFWLEIVNVLVRRYGNSPALVAEAIRELDELGLQTVEIDRPLLLLALDRMAAHELSVYDAAYLALAEAVDARLLTLDASLGAAAAATERAIPRPPGAPDGTTERPAPYRAAPLSAWSGFGAYLADLRWKAEAHS